MYSVLLPRIRAKDLSPTPSPFKSFPPPTDIFMLADQIPQHFPCTLAVCRFASQVEVHQTHSETHLVL